MLQVRHAAPNGLGRKLVKGFEMKAQRNPQDWLPVGQRVSVNAPAPFSYDADGNPVRLYVGVIAEHLSGGAVAVLFDHYPYTWDYSAGEARGFSKQY